MSKQFAEFKINETFSLESTSSGIDGDKINPKEGATPYITRGINENGIRQYVTDAQPGNWEKDKGNVITIGLDTQTAYYQPVPFITGQNIHVLSHESMSQRVAMYIVPQLKKLMLKYSWGGNGATLGRLSQDTLVLPVTDTTANTPNPEPDWEYMENYIKTIERKYIDQIAEHNSKEQAILKQLHPESINTKPEAHGFEEFKIGDIFNITPTSYHKTTSPPTSDLVPQVTNTTQPNGISSFEPYAPNNEKNVITFSDTTVGGDTLFYQPVDFLGYSHIQKMTPAETVLTRRKAMYAITAFKKSVNGKYDYGAKFNRDNATKTDIQLPVTPTGEIDWDYMENYIAWIETQERERVERYVQHVKNRS